MNYFYQECVKILFSPFSELQEWKNFSGPSCVHLSEICTELTIPFLLCPDPVLPLTREQTNRYVYLCDLLYNFTLQHQHRSVFFVMSTNIVLRVATLLKAKDKHLRHGELTFFHGDRTCLLTLVLLFPSCLSILPIIVKAKQSKYTFPNHEA